LPTESHATRRHFANPIFYLLRGFDVAVAATDMQQHSSSADVFLARKECLLPPTSSTGNDQPVSDRNEVQDGPSHFGDAYPFEAQARTSGSALFHTAGDDLHTHHSTLEHTGNSATLGSVTLARAREMNRRSQARYRQRVKVPPSIDRMHQVDRSLTSREASLCLSNVHEHARLIFRFLRSWSCKLAMSVSYCSGSP
jgi:hypothetical protein